jgi:hypothetical protein
MIDTRDAACWLAIAALAFTIAAVRLVWIGDDVSSTDDHLGDST